MKRKLISVFLFVLFQADTLKAQCWDKVYSENRQWFAFQDDSTLWSWGGGNDAGQSGNCTFSGTLEPTILGNSGQKWLSLSFKANGALAIDSEGQLWGWGSNSNKRLIDTNLGNLYCPLLVNGDNDWNKVAIGDNHSLAIKKDGTLWAWGGNSNGQLGNGSTNSESSPIQIGLDSTWEIISASQNCSFGIKNDGSLWAWGSNYNKRLGDGSSVDRLLPFQIGTASDWRTIEAVNNYTMGIKTDGTLWAWGSNLSGQLGNGTKDSIFVPTQIGNDSDWEAINISGSSFSFAIKNDGSLWGWGYNLNGTLGDGTTNERLIPIQVGIGKNWKSVSGGLHSSIAITENGQLHQIDTSHFFNEIYRLETCIAAGNLDVEKYRDIVIYPNPAKDQVIIELKDKIYSPIQLSLYRSDGKLVFQQLMSESENSIDISNVEKGMYIIHLIGGDLNAHSKLLIN